jgi:hypothetical protein
LVTASCLGNYNQQSSIYRKRINQRQAKKRKKPAGSEEFGNWIIKGDATNLGKEGWRTNISPQTLEEWRG